jgi:GntR family transcriptional regulator/MocR family aminotransferase
MTKQSRGAMLPLLSGPATAGLSLRDQIYKTCLAAIVDGRLAGGARLPSARQLAADWRISRNTVDDAIGRLHAEGFVVRRIGAGTFVAARASARRANVQRRRPAALGRKALAAVSAWGRSTTSSYLSASVPKGVPFLAGMPALDAFPLTLWRRLVARRLRVGGVGLLGYLPSLGHPALRDATARHLVSSRGIDCDAGQVMILNSSMQAVDLVSRVLLEASDTVWIEDPCFPNLRGALAMSGARIQPVPVDAQGLDVEEGARRAAPALVYVAPSCQYPMGVTMSLERRLALLRHAASTGAWIVEDDYQSEFTYADRPLVSIHSLDRSERTLYVGTFTNSMFPSLRLAYIVLPRSLVPVFEAVRRQLDDHTHGAMQAVLADFMDGGHFTAHLRRMRALYHGRRDALLSACARLLPPTAVLGPAGSGMNVALHLPARQADKAVAARAAASGLHVLPLSRYASGPLPPNGLLLGYAALTERQIAAGVARLAAVLAPGDREAARKRR